MHARIIGGLVLALALGGAAEAQSLTELMQKAAYLESTAGDLDAAIRVYQQVVAGAVPGTDLHTAAELRLDAARAARRARPRVPLGTFDGRTYRHMRTGLTIDLPPGWNVDGTRPSSDDGDRAEFVSADSNLNVRLWMIPEKNDLASLNRKLDESPVKKQESFGGPDQFRLREGSIQRAVINGKAAMVAVADIGTASDAEVQYMTWIYTESTHTYFWTTMRAQDFERLRPVVDSLIYAAVVP